MIGGTLIIDFVVYNSLKQVLFKKWTRMGVVKLVLPWFQIGYRQQQALPECVTSKGFSHDQGVDEQWYDVLGHNSLRERMQLPWKIQIELVPLLMAFSELVY